MGTVTVRVVVDGVVQGVGYREWTRAEAMKLGVDGWVRNRRDGTVEAAFRGPVEAVETMLARLRKGPRGSTVTGVAAEAWRGAMDPGFQVVPTV